MEFFSKRKLAVILALCSISSGKNNFTSGLTKPQKAGIITLFSALGSIFPVLVGCKIYKIYKHFNPDSLDDSDKKDNESKDNERLFSQYQKFLRDMESVTSTLMGSCGSIEICKSWCKEILKKFKDSKNEFRCDKCGVVTHYVYLDENNPKLGEIKQFMIDNKIPDIFDAAEKLGRKIVPLFDICEFTLRSRKRKNISLHFACVERSFIKDPQRHVCAVYHDDGELQCDDD